MKIAIFVHCFFPEHFYGTETYTLNIATNLLNLGHTVTVVAGTFYGEPTKGDTVSSYVYNGVDVLVIDKNFFPNRRVRDTYNQPEMAPVLRSVLTRLQPDVIHVTHLINHTAMLLDLAREMEIPTVATLTDFFGFCFTNKLEDARGLLCSGPSRDRSNCVACYLKVAGTAHTSHPLLVWLRSQLPLSLFSRLIVLAARLHLLPAKELAHVVTDLQERPNLLGERYNRTYGTVIAPTAFLAKAYRANGLQVPIRTHWFGVDIQRSPKPPRDHEAPLRLGYIGQIAEHKGVDLLLEAFRRVQPCRAEVIIYGPLDQDPVYAQRLQGIAGPNVQFRATFPPEEMMAVMGELDVLVIPSRWYENSPLVLLYALATHTPVIVSRVEGLTEFLEEGVNGFSFERGSCVDLVRVLQGFLSDPTLAGRLSGSTQYEHTTAVMAAELEAVYLEASGGSISRSTQPSR
jgi:glycosyltransferase involved in cell wall biosynthesis